MIFTSILTMATVWVTLVDTKLKITHKLKAVAPKIATFCLCT